MADNYMHGEHVVLTVDRPGVQVFRPAHTLQCSNSLGCRRQVKFLGTPLQDDAEALTHVAIDIEQDEKRDRHRKQRINHRGIHEMHHQGTNEHCHPAQHILQQVQRYHTLIEGAATAQTQHRHTIDDHSQHCQQEHSLCIGLFRMQQPGHGVEQDHHTSHQQDQGVDNRPQ